MVNLQDRYQKLDKIGEGSSGVVFRCRCRESGRIVAIKKVRFSYEGAGCDRAGGTEMSGSVFGASAQVLREVSMLRLLEGHPNVVQLLDAFVDAGRMFMVCEYFERDLSEHMQRGRLLSGRVKRYAWQLLSALLHCHARLIAHRDIKPQNVLIRLSTDEAKLCDFSLARPLIVQPTGVANVQTRKVASLWYRSPEILLGGDASGINLDIWSVGCVIAEMLKHSPLFPGSSEIGMLFEQFQALGTPSESSWPGVSELPHWTENFPKFEAASGADALLRATGCGELAAHLLAGMLCCDPNGRQSPGPLLAHAYFVDLDRTLPGNGSPRTGQTRNKSSKSTSGAVAPRDREEAQEQDCPVLDRQESTRASEAALSTKRAPLSFFGGARNCGGEECGADGEQNRQAKQARRNHQLMSLERFAYK